MTIIEANDLAGAGSEIVAPEHVETPEVTTPESDAKPETQTEETKPSDDGDKTVKRMERRIDRLTAARYQAEAEAQQLREQLSRYTSAHKDDTDGEQDISALVQKEAQRLREMESIQRSSSQLRNDLLKEVGQEENLQRLLQMITVEVGPLVQPDGRWTVLGEAIVDSDVSAKLLVHLGKNPELAEGLQGLTPAQLGRRIARIEADMNKQPESPKPSNAPKPLAPVKAASGSVTPGADSPDFLAWKLKQLKG
jgi:hypothetical protein